MRKATVKKIEKHGSNYEVYLPACASATGKYIRKRFKRKGEALAYADQLNIKLAARTGAPCKMKSALSLPAIRTS